jgi:tRNA A-37 threonylcarbamoyl transferase component Bud32
MQANARHAVAEGEQPHRCPSCGTPYAAQENDAGCPVCLLRQAMQPGATVEDYLSEDGRFDHYELIRREDGAPYELGRGAMGVTYKAFDTVLHHRVALKIIDVRFAAEPNVRKRFLREARAAARLRHQNLASVFYYGTRKSDGQCFYAMELIEGETLEVHLRRSGLLSPALALKVVTQVAKALVAAEVHGLVHRDLKPSNLMLVEGPELIVKVIDFGLAKAVATAGSEAITHGSFVGTPAFASPEQFTGTSVDIRSDLYSLGITLWEMLTGQTPFRGDYTQVMYQHQHALLPFGQLEGVPQPVVVLIEILLAKDPARRFQNPNELLKAMPRITSAIGSGGAITHESFQNVAVAAAGRTPAEPGPVKISVARLPVTGGDLFGREEDIDFLDDAWANQDINVVTIVAWAGVGKSTLVNHWLRRMAADHYRAAELVFGWSFYRQGGSRETSSADKFLEAALTWFGDPNSWLGTAWEKGERLAKLVAQRRTLLVLDGLEPLQNPPGPQEGHIREPALQALLRELAAFNTGLCVITTRLPVADLADHEHTSALRLDLEQISSDSGAKLLRALGIKGQEAELRCASDEFSGHCLALTLLGSYLTDAYYGDIRHRREVSARLVHDVRQGAHARNVLESYQAWFGEGPELAVLRMLGLFDRPADETALEVLLKPPAIRDLTEPLTDLSPSEWRTILSKLRRARLLVGEDPHNPRCLDTHPLIREYFGEQLQSQLTDAWRECNRRLYYHYQAIAPQLPDSLQEMEPLFLAVICGCYAGLFGQALHEVYIPRIQRGNAFFAAKVLGARGTLLSILAHFFEDGRWGSPLKMGAEAQSFSAEDQLFILSQTALYLTVMPGFAAQETRVYHKRAESPCDSIHGPLLQHSALIGHWRYCLITDKLTVAMQIAKRIDSLAHEQNDATLLLGAYRALACTHYYLGDFDASRQFAIRGLQIWYSGDVKSYVRESEPPAVACLCDKAQSEWHFEQVASSQATMAEAILQAQELNDMPGLAEATYFATCLSHYGRNPSEVARLASDLIEMSTRQNFALWLARGTVLRGWAHSASGGTVQGLAWIEDGIGVLRVNGVMLGLPYYLALKAEALYLADRTSDSLEAINEAEGLATKSGEYWWYAELHRLRGVFLAAMGAGETKIETSFCEAIKIAKEQNSISLGKRAEGSYAEYRHEKARASGGRGFRLPLS